MFFFVQLQSSLLTATTDDNSVPNYEEVIVYPMNLDILQAKIKTKHYKSIEAFHSDTKWLLYNCAVLPGRVFFYPILIEQYRFL